MQMANRAHSFAHTCNVENTQKCDELDDNNSKDQQNEIEPNIDKRVEEDDDEKTAWNRFS